VDEKEFITLLPDLLNPGYTAVRMVAGSNKRKIIGRVRFLGPSSWVTIRLAVFSSSNLLNNQLLHHFLQYLLESFFLLIDLQTSF
jgi:hypothetical protein